MLLFCGGRRPRLEMSPACFSAVSVQKPATNMEFQQIRFCNCPIISRQFLGVGEMAPGNQYQARDPPISPVAATRTAGLGRGASPARAPAAPARAPATSAAPAAPVAPAWGKKRMGRCAVDFPFQQPQNWGCSIQTKTNPSKKA